MPREQCPMALAAELVGDKWVLLILREAFYGVCRYDDMRLDLDIPRAMLTDRLNRLVSDGLLERRVYQEPGTRTRHAYILTRKGRSLALVMMALTQWGEAHLTGGDAPVAVIDRETSGELRVGLNDEHGRTVPLERAILSKR